MPTSSHDGEYMREYVRETCEQALKLLANGQARPALTIVETNRRSPKPLNP